MRIVAEHFPADVLVAAYDICESALERLLSELGALLLWLRATKDGQLFFVYRWTEMRRV